MEHSAWDVRVTNRCDTFYRVTICPENPEMLENCTYVREMSGFFCKSRGIVGQSLVVENCSKALPKIA